MKRAAAVALALAGACHTDPSAPHLARGNVLVNTGHRDERWRSTGGRAPRARSALPRERLGDAQYDLGRKAEALSSYRDAAAVDPGSVTARIGVARVLGDQEISRAHAPSWTRRWSAPHEPLPAALARQSRRPRRRPEGGAGGL